jgi:YfiH family protein
MHNWHWQTWQGLPYLTCSVLKDFPHGFFTQHWSRPPEKLVEALHPIAQVYRVKQVHGNTVLSASEIEQAALQAPNQSNEETLNPAALSDADGLITEQGTQAVWVCTADCTPVLIADPETGQVAAVHAGWRGTATRIVPEAIARLQAQGSRLEDLQIAMGPAIAGEVYQVSTTVAAQVGATIVDRAVASRATTGNLCLEAPQADDVDTTLAALRQLPDSPLLDDPQPGRARLDVRRVNALQLEQIGIEPDQVAIAPYCTYQNPDYFFSYRRDRQKKVQWSGIVSLNFT